MNFLIPTFYFDDVIYDIAKQYHRHLGIDNASFLLLQSKKCISIPKCL